MKHFLNRLLEGIVLLFRRLKGPSSYREIVPHMGQSSVMVGQSISGFEITIYCNRKRYRRKYDRWFVPTEYDVLYRVFSRASDNAPARLREACQALDRDIHPQLPEFISDDLQKKAAVEAYLQLLVNTLESMDDGFNSG